MDEKKPGRKFVARWDKSIFVDVYEDGDFRLVVQKNGDFHILTDNVLPAFFRPFPELNSEVEPDE